MKREILPVLLVLFTFGQGSQAAFRCGSSLVNEGDWPAEVEQYCGAPDYLSNYPTAIAPGLAVVQNEEHWYYNPGPQRFVKRLVFINGKLAKVENLGYGFHISSRHDCDAGTLRQIGNEYELIARCGEPESKRVEWQIPPDRHHSENWKVQEPVLMQEWLYKFSSKRLRQIVTLRNGNVVNVDSRAGL